MAAFPELPVVALCASFMSRPALELPAVLEEGIAGQVLENDGGRFRVRHNLLRDAIYVDLPLSVRRALHREAGQQLAGQLGGDQAVGTRAEG